MGRSAWAWPGGAPVLLLLLLSLSAEVRAGVDYCSVHTFRSNSSWLQFTKEMSSREYYVTGAFKSLHCCVKGYRSIEWYKDGKPYPWPGSFILYPESANQTVYSPAAQATDAANYSCLVRNDTSESWHHTALILVGDTSSLPAESLPYSGRALPTYTPRDQVVRLGDDARFFCEAFIGHVSLPDARSAIWWRREGENENAPEGGAVALAGRHRGVLQKDTSREDEQILGVFLEIRGVRREDLGQYTCAIHSLDNQRLLLRAWLRQAEAMPHGGRVNPDSVEEEERGRRHLLLQLVCAGTAAVALAMVAVRFLPEIRVAVRDALARQSSDDGCEWDALLCHTPSDAGATLALLAPPLARLGFRTRAQTLTPARPQLWAEEVAVAGPRSSRLVVLLSPQLLGAWNGEALAAAAATLGQMHPMPVLVALQPVPDAQGTAEAGAARRVVQWGAGDAQRHAFWTALRLRLPPRPRGATAPPPPPPKQPLAAMPSPRRQRTGSRESLEVLV